MAIGSCLESTYHLRRAEPEFCKTRIHPAACLSQTARTAQEMTTSLEAGWAFLVFGDCADSCDSSQCLAAVIHRLENAD